MACDEILQAALARPRRGRERLAPALLFRLEHPAALGRAHEPAADRASAVGAAAVRHQVRAHLRQPAAD